MMDPRPNRFGERVRDVYESPWMRAHFGQPLLPHSPADR
jgi:hypothetical protein